MSPNVGRILQRARDLGESSWRVGIALGVDPAALEQIERRLDQLDARQGRSASTGAELRTES